ncbi:hypothetical protein DRE_02654 [Drechslerella stenobrocha 248]|uniref:Uncharacterized protein n=1 Tax=Drechslerella stenobrocha 248 TaxID=1043628 RepID=W7IFY1_9PEZI|nr:hypothetical protein DRE_02654 [Drechslerella stenobrocha 248]
MPSPALVVQRDAGPNANDSRPTLTIYAHQIANQASQTGSLLSSSLEKIAIEYDKLHKILQDTKSRIDGHDKVNNDFGGVLSKIDTLVTKQQATVLSLSETVEAIEEAHSTVEQTMCNLSTKIDIQSSMLERLVEHQRDYAESLAAFQLKLDAALEKNPRRSRLVSKLDFNQEQADVSLETVPTLPALTGQLPILLDTQSTESSLGMVAETPAPVKKPTRKLEALKETQSSNRVRVVRKTNINKAARQNTEGLRRSKRHRGPGLTLAAEPTPDEVFYGQSKDNSDTDSQALDNPKRQRTVGDSNYAKEQEVPSAADNSVDAPASKQQDNKRVLAGPATQEAWETDTTAP